MKRETFFRYCSGSLVALCTAVVPFLMNSCGGSVSQQGVAKPESFPVMAVDTVTVTVYADFATELQSDLVVDIRPRVSGYIDKISVSEGSSVKKNQELFIIDQDDLRAKFNSAKASVNVAKAAVKTAKLEVRKLTPLVEKDIISSFELDNAKSNLQSAKAQLEYAKSQQDNAQIDLNFARIVSPVNGVVGRVVVREGTLVGSSNVDPLTTISGDGDVSAYFSVDERSLQGLTRSIPGITLKDKIANMPYLQLVMADGSIYEHSGRPEIASGLVDINTGSIQLKAVFPNPEGTLRTGSSGVVRIPATLAGMVLVPQKVTYELQDKRMVYAVDNAGVIQSRRITTEGISGPFFIVTEGLTLGDKILYEGVDKVRENQVIAPQILKSDSLYNALQNMASAPVEM